MKKVFMLLISVAVLTACNNKPASIDIAKETEALLNADKDFCATEMQQGMAKAMEKYYDTAVVAIMPNAPVEMGKATILKSLSEHKMDSLTSLNWTTDKAVVSSSGDLGYTYGHYQFKAKTKEGVDTVYYGAYATFWKKQGDGSWKAVVDQNNDTPKP